MSVAPSVTPDPFDAFVELIRAQRARLVRAARTEGLGPEDALEATQEGLLTFFQLSRRDEVPPDAAEWPAFLTTIVRNAARNRRRRHHLARHHDDLDALGEAPDDETVEELTLRAEEHVRLRACVARLCGTQRGVVTLRLLEERDGEDVAATLGITRGYVDVLLHRAKAELRACMVEHDHGP